MTGSNAQNVSFDIAVNPTSSPRNGVIAVRAGDETGGPKGTIAVTQAAASLTASVNHTQLAATADASGTLMVAGTAGLSYSIAKSDWLTLTGDLSGTTTGSEQTFGYKTSGLNLNSTNNIGNIVVKIGNATTGIDNGLINTIAVVQNGSTFTVTPTILELEKTASSGSVTVTGTKGLPWTLTKNVGSSDAITVNTGGGIIGDTGETVTFNATKNTSAARSATFTIAVTGGNHSQTVTVNQVTGIDPSLVEINADIVLEFNESKYSSDSRYAPFNYDGGTVSGSTGSDRGTVPYSIEVEKTQKNSNYTYENAIKACPSGWRVPTLIEMYAIWIKCRGGNKDATDNEDASTAIGEKLADAWFWTSSVFGGNSYQRVRMTPGNGDCTSAVTAGYGSRTNMVRCVRDI